MTGDAWRDSAECRNVDPALPANLSQHGGSVADVEFRIT